MNRDSVAEMDNETPIKTDTFCYALHCFEKENLPNAAGSGQFLTEKSEECSSKQPVSNRDLRDTVVFLKNSIIVRITEQNKRIEVIPSNSAYRTPLREFQPGMKDPWLHEPDAIFSAFSQRKVVAIETHHSMLLVFSPLYSSLCAFLPSQDVQPDGEH
ncbi:hypothetical protein TNCV_4048671 [Trichonephila clavipes]|nr:hypothetical protein TNCV_4048671 [Trichonephila clavipes]